MDCNLIKLIAKAVATKGGVTEQGIIVFEESNLYKIVSEATVKAYKKVR